MDNGFIDRRHEWSTAKQMGNIATEALRALRFRRERGGDAGCGYCRSAIDCLLSAASDPKNTDRKEEFESAARVLQDFFLEGNTLNTKEEDLEQFYNSYIDYYMEHM